MNVGSCSFAAGFNDFDEIHGHGFRIGIPDPDHFIISGGDPVPDDIIDDPILQIRSQFCIIQFNNGAFFLCDQEQLRFRIIDRYIPARNGCDPRIFFRFINQDDAIARLIQR